LSQKTWSSGPVVDPVLFTEGRANRLCRESAASGSGMMEYWNTGMLGLVQRDLIV